MPHYPCLHHLCCNMCGIHAWPKFLLKKKKKTKRENLFQFNKRRNPAVTISHEKRNVVGTAYQKREMKKTKTERIGKRRLTVTTAFGIILQQPFVFPFHFILYVFVFEQKFRLLLAFNVRALLVTPPPSSLIETCRICGLLVWFKKTMQVLPNWWN